MNKIQAQKNYSACMKQNGSTENVYRLIRDFGRLLHRSISAESMRTVQQKFRDFRHSYAPQG